MKPSHSILIVVLRIILGAIFLYAGAVKIQNPQAFADSIATFQILPPSLITLVALSLPPFEILAGLLLITGYQKRVAIVAILTISTVFLLAIGQALLRGITVDCGCFGSSMPSSFETWLTFTRDILLVVIAAVLYREQ